MVTREAGKPVNSVTPDLMCVVPTENHRLSEGESGKMLSLKSIRW